MEEKDLSFLLHRKIKITVNEKINDKIKEHNLEGYVAQIRYGLPAGPKLYIIRDGGQVNWICPHKKNVSDLRIRILDWESKEEEEDDSRFKLMDLDE